MKNSKISDEQSSFFITEKRLLVWFSIEVLLILVICAALKVNAAVAVAAIGAPGGLLAAFYNYNYRKYEEKKKALNNGVLVGVVGQEKK